ncbi:leishmanolysin-like peptidase 2 [Ochotona curzoniae]|uniref:leishmanolysin-like peptidase 2 n=1 Tax=Ochotona curzoniae TaxID=130825 RepID=UPI001B345868|nr:leishmanolysin-like peptidase 2 [Ochotona curzoniae]
MGRCQRPLLLLLLPALLRTAASRCLHDETQKSVNLLRPPSTQAPPKPRSSALSLSASYNPQPLRIQTCYIVVPTSDGTWDPRGDGARGRTRALDAVREATRRIQGFLAVIPVQGPLLLSRDPGQYCLAVWGDPGTPNYHRCSLLNPGYKGEACLGAKIPDAHLRGYALWPEQGPPRMVQPDGPGVQNTDFLLYVQVAHTSKCHQEPSVIAYAAYCQLDREDRPLAGTIIYCAHHLASPSLSDRDLVTVTLHELLHALGFSGQLFKKWRDCPWGPSVTENCSTRQQVTRRDEWGQLLLTTPAVSHSLAQHLGVSGMSPGVPLEEEGPWSSHWEARLLQGSIMAATFDGAQRTRLDPITLAAFKDSGWYQVNHSAAEELLWGQGSGLEFGLVTTCGTGSSDFFCTGSGLGCHYLHLDKGRCSSDPMLEGCRMYKPLANGSECWKTENGLPAGAENPHGEIYAPQSRCFLANLTSELLPEDPTRHPSWVPYSMEMALVGRCYLHQCMERGLYQVQVEGSPWVLCLPGKAIQIPGYHGLLLCPRGRLCQTHRGLNTITSPPLRPSTQDQLLQLSLGLAGHPGFSLGMEERKELAEMILQAVVSRGGISRCHFHSPSVTTGLVFTVYMWKAPGCQGPSAAELHRALTLSLQQKPLEVYHGGARFITQQSKLPATLDHYFSTGLCLMLLILGGMLGAMAYQKRASLRVGPSTSDHPQEIHSTRGPARV